MHYSLLATITLLVGCSDTSFFLPENALEGDLRMQTVAEGSFLAPEDPLRVSFDQESGTRFDRVRITVTESDGDNRERFERSRDDFGADLEVEIPVESLRDGLYRIEIDVFDGAREVLRETRNVFIVNSSYSLSGISSYPARVYPGSRSIFETNVEGGNAWIQWRVNDEIVASGTVSDGYEQFEWQAPGTEGVYRVRVDLYPQAPVSSSSYRFSSSVHESSDVYVTRSDPGDESTFGPPSSYFALFSLRGHFRDTGVRTGLSDWSTEGRPIGTPRLRVENDLFGYYLDGASGVESEGLALPFIDSSLAPFSLNMVLLPEDSPASRTIFETASEDGRFALRLDTDSSGIPRLRIERDGRRVTTSSRYPMLTEGESARVSVSVSPGSEHTTVMWFADGHLASIEQVDLGFSASPLGASPTRAAQTRVITDENEISVRPGYTRIGAGSGGFVGLVEEFGVYFRDEQDRLATDDALFRDAMDSRYAGRLAYAQGFEGLFMPEELRTVGRVTVRAGEIELEPGSQVHFPAFLFEDEDLIVELELGADAFDARGEFRFAESRNESGLLSVLSDGEARFAGNRVRERFALDNGSTLLLRFRHDGRSLLVRGASGEEDRIELSGTSFDGVTLSAHHPEGRSVPLRVLSVLAHRDRAGLAERLDFSEAP